MQPYEDALEASSYFSTCGKVGPATFLKGPRSIPCRLLNRGFQVIYFDRSTTQEKRLGRFDLRNVANLEPSATTEGVELMLAEGSRHHTLCFKFRPEDRTDWIGLWAAAVAEERVHASLIPFRDAELAATFNREHGSDDVLLSSVFVKLGTCLTPRNVEKKQMPHPQADASKRKSAYEGSSSCDLVLAVTTWQTTAQITTPSKIITCAEPKPICRTPGNQKRAGNDADQDAAVEQDPTLSAALQLDSAEGALARARAMRENQSRGQTTALPDAASTDRAYTSPAHTIQRSASLDGTNESLHTEVIEYEV